MIRTRGKKVAYGELWFDEALTGGLPDILICRQRTQPWPGSASTPFTTSVLDLSQDEARLFAAIRPTAQYKIRRAEAKDRGVCAFLEDPQPHLEAFCDFFDGFASGRGLKPAHRNWLQQAAAARMLALSNVAVNGQVLVWHAYIINGQRARLLHSASHFRVQEAQLRAVTGRLNRWLHWRDVLEFKKREYRIYDFGGIFSFSGVASEQGINRFKSDFGGVQSVSYDCTMPLTWKGRVYLALLKWRERLSARTPPA